MRVVTLMCLAFAGLLGVAGSGAAVLARGQSAPPAVQPQAAPAQAAPGAPAAAAPAAPSTAGRSTVPASIRAAEKRRRSYASCNRESHNRNLRGGARRRFLIRCKLGYERRRPAQVPTQTVQPQPPQQPAKANPAQTQPPAKGATPQPLQPAKRP
ncbi:serine/threonine protein kinase [Methylobacterium haplocladii]|uniref:Serine/threonine protein kinase n=1 Tax=Methylobacterium haplocladii TaxID=1176176 RepID=A0A512IT02_9HYPH|nr:serine/threonine protein kinase [Methylobacterium haplocladii]GEP00796.1 hypothetical protein MHA02_31830 [Methylobacterium haplocladii]GJD83131.1 hypothetical protein HPGCJGGD_0993 [Methylobacterium haplocladii]GLS59310.1 hypothetical protein GCM10007887_19760 [Methylobacterium haplocladii]